MPSITEYKPINRFPYQFVSPFSYSARSVLYSSITINRNNDDECLSCIVCKEINKIIARQAIKFRNFNQSLEVGEETVGNVIDTGTEINIWFDNSGSMDATLEPLIEMRDTILRPALLPAYNNDNALYDERVKILFMNDETVFGRNTYEACILCAAKPKSEPTRTKSVNLIFQDESTPYNAEGGFDPTSRTSDYDADVTILRSSILGDTAIFSVIFQVSGYDGFKQFLQTTKSCSFAYQGIYGICDLPRLEVKYDVNSGDAPQYYLELILEELRQLGFTNI